MASHGCRRGRRRFRREDKGKAVLYGKFRYSDAEVTSQESDWSFTVARRNYMTLHAILPLIAESSAISRFVLQPLAGSDSFDSTFRTRIARERHVALQRTRAD